MYVVESKEKGNDKYETQKDCGSVSVPKSCDHGMCLKNIFMGTIGDSIVRRVLGSLFVRTRQGPDLSFSILSSLPRP